MHYSREASHATANVSSWRRTASCGVEIMDAGLLQALSTRVQVEGICCCANKTLRAAISPAEGRGDSRPLGLRAGQEQDLQLRMPAAAG